VIETSIRQSQNDPSALLYADTLASRFPRDPEALILAAEAMSRRHLIDDRIRGLFERAIAIDSAAQTNPNAPCRLCVAFELLAEAFQWADSGAAAEAVLERWIALRPTDPVAVHELAMHQFHQGRYDTGVQTLRRLSGLPARLADPSVNPLMLGRLLTGRLDEADAECAVQLRQEDARVVGAYRSICAIVWRNQGRYHEATGLVFSDRLPDGSRLAVRVPRDRLGEAVLDLEMNRPVVALRALDAMAPPRNDTADARGRVARRLTWSLALRATAAVLAHEYGLAERLTDSAEAVGRESLDGRDPLVHYFIRGLLARASGADQTAIDFFERSVRSWTFGYTRANLELARVLLETGRASEAVPRLQSALRGGWAGLNLDVTRTELHELLAQCFAAIGARDSATAHYAAVERAWRRADPPFAPRYRAARDWLARRGG
jgi:tetratricopeptide (TPR) repeat protein